MQKIQILKNFWKVPQLPWTPFFLDTPDKLFVQIFLGQFIQSSMQNLESVAQKSRLTN